MMKFAVASIAALTASAAFAQAPQAAQPAAPAAPAGQPAAAQPVPGAATASQPTTAQPATAQPAPDASTTAQAAPSSNTNAQVAAVVEAGFPKYDTNKDGQLSEAEFKQWISDLKTQELTAQGKPADPAAVSQYASAALAVADKDKDGVITKQDLTSFLGG